MKPLFWVGLTLLILGLVSLVVPVPSTESSGVGVGDLSVQVETKTEEKIPPLVSGLIILGGVALIIVAKTKK
ncbi:MAG: hypothetical protein KIT83_20180 [Bryobacterales bacterium]|nr:hypothetical protein [Bryobacterales bacterium]